MTRKKRAAKDPPAPTLADMPQNPEFQSFMGSLRTIMSVPKTEIDRLIAEERELKERLITEVQEIEERLSGAPTCQPD